MWSLTAYHIQALRDNPECAAEELAGLQDETDPGLAVALTCKLRKPAVMKQTGKPLIGILREEGVNGQVEMAAAFDHAGFDCIDIHMTDLLSRNMSLNDLNGIVACGRFFLW